VDDPTEPLERIELAVPGHEHWAGVGRGALELLADVIKDQAPSRVVLVSDHGVGPIWAERVRAEVARAGFECALHLTPQGEAAKSREGLFDLLAFLERERVDRAGLILALGGGTVGDVSGLAASLWLRGVRLIHLPTTLLAMVDSALGGKTGINSEVSKNSIGTFHQPVAVLSDLDLLSTLPRDQYLAAFGEVVKYGVAMDAELARLLQAEAARLRSPSDPLLARVVARCVELKAQVVAADEHDRGGRAILNYGHTIAHALEAASGYTATHGRAVALGMRGAALLGQRSGFTEPALVQEQDRLLAAYDLPGSLPRVDPELALEALGRDKKSAFGRLGWVLPRRLGEAVISRQLDSDLVRQVVLEILG